MAGGAGRRRRTSATASLGCTVTVLPEKRVELGRRASPEGLMACQPVLGLSQGSPAKVEPMLAAVYGPHDQSRRFEYLQMFRNCGLCRPEATAKVAGTSRSAVGQGLDHGSPRPIRERTKGHIERRRSHSHMT